MDTDIIVSFVERVNDVEVEVHTADCCMDLVEKLYKEGKDVEVHGVRYKILDVIPCVNGKTIYKVYVSSI